ncbi:hypothetical protein Q6Y56_002998 [Salmonella enterica]|nr:hypothetical protein [Salmonella enterica]HBC0148605.1 hypothetical protein [Salmonella enterica subsp. houtenae]EKA0331341.1 hypothetical protein [Salmonella enterica]EKA6129488.1 hypothetical protein [Salmonella enterica]EKD3594464.1 hypothetical protein [Salmonella enterica]
MSQIDNAVTSSSKRAYRKGMPLSVRGKCVRYPVKGRLINL